MIGIVAPSSKVPKVELRLGVEKLKEAGFHPRVHPQCLKSHLYFAGTDQDRAQAFVDYAMDPSIDVIWCARGGYGAARLLPLIEKLIGERGGQVPKNKLLIGYSDATAMFEHAQVKWNWSVLHATMPGLRGFLKFTKAEWNTLVCFVNKTPVEKPWGNLKLRQLAGPKISQPIEARLTGGNLMVWTSIVGSPYYFKPAGKILFFEEISEHPYRIDRLITQLELSGGFEGIRAIVLGEFIDCKDSVSLMLKKMPKRGLLDPVLKNPKPRDLEPLRKTLNEKKIIPELFAEVAIKHGVPLLSGFPAGHGAGHAPLPIGARYSVTPSGEIHLLEWNWFS